MAFSIDTDTLGLLSRCAKCNGEFEPRCTCARLRNKIMLHSCSQLCIAAGVVLECTGCCGAAHHPGQMALSLGFLALGAAGSCRPLSAEELPDGSPIPAGVRSAHQQFWRCSRCGHIYWHGAQYSNAVGRLTRELQRFAVR